MISAREKYAEVERLAMAQATNAGALSIHNAQALTLSPDWEPPTPFMKYEVPAFPTQALPGIMRDYVLAVSESLQVPVDMAAVSVLVTASVCVQRKYRVQGKPGWTEPLNLFAAVVARPAERKSAALQCTLKFLNEYERQENTARRAAIAQYETRVNVLTAEITALEKKAASTGELADFEAACRKKAELAELQEVKPLRLTADDCTPEALTSLLAENGGRMAVISAEGGIFDILAGRYSNSGGANIDVFLKGHPGDTLRVDRRGRRSEHIERPALSVLLMIQPSVLEGIMGNGTFQGRGLTQRFLYCLPASKVGGRPLETRPVPPEKEAAFRAMVYDLLALPVPPADEPVMELSAQAYELFAAFYGLLEPRLIDDLEHISEWAGKLCGAILRIAGILHAAQCLHAASQERISAETMQGAITIGHYFLAHAKAAHALMGADEKTRGAQYILRQLEKSGYNRITRTDLTRLCRGRFPRIEDMEPALALLLNNRYIRAEKSTATGVGRKQTAYEINPHFTGNTGNNGKNSPDSDILSIHSMFSSTQAIESRFPKGEEI